MNNTTINLCMNASANSVTEGYWKTKNFAVVLNQVTTAFLLLFIVVGLPWNIMVVIVAIKKRLYHQPTIMLLLNLVGTDILILLIHYPNIIVIGIARGYVFGSTDVMRCQTCKFVIFVPLTLTMDSLFVIALISFDRFLFIYKPLQYQRKTNKRRTLVSIASTTMLSIAIGVIPAITPGAIVYDTDMFCSISIKIYWYIIVFISVACIALVVIVVCNIWVIYIVLMNIKEVYNIRKSLYTLEKRKSLMQDLSERVRDERHKKQLHLFRVFGGLLLSNILTWFPLVLYFVLKILNVNMPLWVFSLVNVIFLSQVAIHPILETILITDVREPLKEMVTCGLLKKRKDDFEKTEDQTSSFCLCCTSAEVYGDDHNSCSFMLKLINAAVLPKDNSSSSRASTHDNGGQTSNHSSDGHIL